MRFTKRTNLSVTILLLLFGLTCILLLPGLPIGRAATTPHAPSQKSSSSGLDGSRQAAMTVSAQAANGRVTWVAWVEQDKRVEVRSLNLNQLVPIGEYPTPLPPTATPALGVTP